MTSALAVLTFNRVDSLKLCLSGLHEHCSQYPLAVFEDCGAYDGTEAFLTVSNQAKQIRTPLGESLEADEYVYTHEGRKMQVFMGRHNLGVAAQSNRAIKWMESVGADHLVILNDDVVVNGDFVSFYAKAHQDLEIGLFCFCDFTSEQYRWTAVRHRGYIVKILPRMTGIAMSITKELTSKIGYFDTTFGAFGNEHVDYTHRARMAGFLRLDGKDQGCLDVDHKLLAHQEVETSLKGPEREKADFEANLAMEKAGRLYAVTSPYRPFRLRTMRAAGGRDGEGIEASSLAGYSVV